VEEKRIEVGLKRVKGLVETFNSIEKIKDQKGRELLRSSFLGNLEELGVPEMLALPPPKNPHTSKE